MLFIYSMWQLYLFSCSKPRRVRKRQVLLPPADRPVTCVPRQSAFEFKFVSNVSGLSTASSSCAAAEKTAAAIIAVKINFFIFLYF